MDSKSLETLVLEVVAKHIKVPSDALSLDTRLNEDLALDSIALLELVLELEERSGLPFRNEHLTLATLATPRTLIKHLLELTPA